MNAAVKAALRNVEHNVYQSLDGLASCCRKRKLHGVREFAEANSKIGSELTQMLAKFRQKQRRLLKEMLKAKQHKKSLEHEYIALQEFASEFAGSGRMHCDMLLREYCEDTTEGSFRDAIARSTEAR